MSTARPAQPARPARPAPPTRADFGAWRTATTRWSDDDVFGHLNNARYFDLIDTAVNAHLADATGLDIRRLDAVGLVAEVSCRYFAEMGYPRPIDLGLAVERLGTSSVIYRIGLFQGGSGAPDEPARAEGRFVHVYVDNTDPGRPVTPVPDVVRRAVAPLLRPAAAAAAAAGRGCPGPSRLVGRRRAARGADGR